MHVRLVVAALIAGLAVSASAAAHAQDTRVPVSGIVRAASGPPLAGASVAAGDADSAQTGADGRFTLQLPRGRHILRASHPAHAAAAREVDVTGPVSGIEIALSPLARFAEEVVVAAVRADADVPMTTRDLDRGDI